LIDLPYEFTGVSQDRHLLWLLVEFKGWPLSGERQYSSAPVVDSLKNGSKSIFIAVFETSNQLTGLAIGKSLNCRPWEY